MSSIVSKLSTPSSLLRALNTAVYYYGPLIDRDSMADALGITRYSASISDHRALAAVYIIHIWSMRAAEYLGARVSDVLRNDMVLIRGLKGSASYRICLPGITRQIEAAGNIMPGMTVAGTTYASVYRFCVASRYGALQPGHINVSRTHLARYETVKEVDKKDNQAAGDLLHHRSPETVNYYRGVKGGRYGCHQVRHIVKSQRQSSRSGRGALEG